MRIQVIGYGYSSNYLNIEEVTTFSSPKSLDYFDLNIIDLRDENIWKNNSFKTDTSFVNIKNDLKSLGEMIEHSRASKILILFPQNENFKTSYNRDNRGKYVHGRSYKLKDITRELISIINDILFIPLDFIRYENTITSLDKELKLSAAFYFNEEMIINNSHNYEQLLHSDKSEKLVAFKRKNTYFTTLDIKDNFELNSFLSNTQIVNKPTNEFPKWFFDLSYFDDQVQKDIITLNEEKINKLETMNLNAHSKLEENDIYKSILYNSGDELVDVILKMLGEIFNYDTNEFEDIHKEDFQLVLNDMTFIIEIKGISSNLKRDNVSQTDTHLQGYKDKLEEEGKKENTKAILIINHQRLKPLEERINIHHNQIDLAKRNGTLILETKIFLKIYEYYIDDLISEKSILKLFETDGLLTIEKVNENLKK